jgi:hypothetical protein
MEITHQQTRVQGKKGHPSEPARPASPPAPPPVVAAAKEYQDEQYDDEERGVIDAAPPSISPLKDTRTLASLGGSENRHL